MEKITHPSRVLLHLLKTCSAPQIYAPQICTPRHQHPCPEINQNMILSKFARIVKYNSASMQFHLNIAFFSQSPAKHQDTKTNKIKKLENNKTKGLVTAN